MPAPQGSRLVFPAGWSGLGYKKATATVVLPSRRSLQLNTPAPLNHPSLLPRKMKAAILALASASTVAAHATFQDLWVNGEDQADACVRAPVRILPRRDSMSRPPTLAHIVPH